MNFTLLLLLVFLFPLFALDPTFSSNLFKEGKLTFSDDFDGELFSVRNKIGAPFFIVNADETLNLGPILDPLKFSKNSNNHSELTSSANFSASFGRLNVAGKI